METLRELEKQKKEIKKKIANKTVTKEDRINFFLISDKINRGIIDVLYERTSLVGSELKNLGFHSFVDITRNGNHKLKTEFEEFIFIQNEKLIKERKKKYAE